MVELFYIDSDVEANFSNCIFNNNSASNGDGGAIYTLSNLVLINCIFSYNVASNGAGIYLEGGNIIINGSHFLENDASQNGSSVFCLNGNFTGTQTDIANNPLFCINCPKCSSSFVCDLSCNNNGNCTLVNLTKICVCNGNLDPLTNCSQLSTNSSIVYSSIVYPSLPLSKPDNNYATIVSAIVGTFVGVAIISVCFVIYYKYHRKNNLKKDDSNTKQSELTDFHKQTPISYSTQTETNSA